MEKFILVKEVETMAKKLGEKKIKFEKN